MISEYHRPKDLTEALTLLARKEPKTMPLAGGSALNKPSQQEFAVVDLQDLGLGSIEHSGNFLKMGAALTLQELVEFNQIASLKLSQMLIKVIQQEASYNLRQVASVAGTLVAAQGVSPFTTALLALDAVLTLQPGDESISLGDILPLRSEKLVGKLITQITIPVNVKLAYEYVARTPADRSIVCAAVAVWPSGRTRLALGGYGSAPILAFDGTEMDGISIAAEDAYSDADDEWASSDFRKDVAKVLASRCVENIKNLG
jgi:CO/xanthine dehydrogenase FAD-binding subunit